MSKADTVRAIIVRGAAEGKEAKDLVQEVVDTCGFSKALARTYINNNWEKALKAATPAEAATAEAATEATQDAGAPETQPEVAAEAQPADTEVAAAVDAAFEQAAETA